MTSAHIILHCLFLDTTEI